MNDILGAPEVVVIKGRVFWFSPLNDFEEACLEAWLRWRTGDAAISLASELAFVELNSVAGATQLLYRSIHRTEPQETVLNLFRFLAEDQNACDAIYEAWIDLNYSASEVLPQSSLGQKAECSDVDIYTLLGRKYHWATPFVVAQMTKKQQLIYLEAIVCTNTASDSLTFDSDEEYQAWVLKNNAR